jgi:opacity protein-like surface antigen
MTRRLLAVLITGAFVLAPSALRAQVSTSILVSGGLSMPVSDLSDQVNSGYNVNVGLNIGAPIVPVGARLEVGYNGFDGKSCCNFSGGTVRIISGTANAILNLGPTSAAPYLIGGLGIYNFHGSTTFNSFTGATTSIDNTKAGVNIGGGLRFPLAGISTFLEARYHVMLGDSFNYTNSQFIPITFGIQF